MNNNNWISVDERLPENFQDVLVFNGYIHLGKSQDGKWYKEWGGFSFVEIRYVTHWQPLPSPPLTESKK